MTLLLKNIFRWNIISLKLNNDNSYNFYMFIIIFIGLFSSILVRSSFITFDMVNSNNEIIIIIIKLLFLFAILYSIKLILDIIKRCIQAFKIIPEFIKWYKQDVKDIKQIITSYYILNILLILLSSYILYHIIIKLNIFIENIYLYIIISSILSSFVFFHYYPINNFYLNNNIKEYSLFVYLLFIFFILFYLLILPFICVKIINCEKMLTFKNDFIKQCLDNTYNMSNPDSGRRIINNLNNNINTISVPDSDNLNISNNISGNTNAIEVRNNNQINLTVNHNNFSIGSTSQIQPQNNDNSILTQSNYASSSSQPQQNLNSNIISPPKYNKYTNAYGLSLSSIEELLKEDFGNLFTTFENVNNNNLELSKESSNNESNNNNNIINNDINNDNNSLVIYSNNDLNNTNEIIEVLHNENNIIENTSQEYINSPKFKVKIKNNFKNSFNQIFKGLKKIKSESNIFNIFNKNNRN